MGAPWGTPAGDQRRRRLTVALFVLAGILLVSMGGAVVAAPLTLPLMYLAVRREPTQPFRWAGAIVGGLTAVEVAWAAVYVLRGEEQPTIWLVPLVAGAAVMAGFLTVGVTPGVPGGRLRETTSRLRRARRGTGPATD